MTPRLLFTLLLIASPSLCFAVAPANDILGKATVLTNSYGVIAAQNLSNATAASTDPLVNGVSAGRSLWFFFPRPVRQGTLSIAITSSTAAGTVSLFHITDPENPAGSLVPAASGNVTAGGTVTISASTWPNNDDMIMVAGTGVFTLTYRFSDYSVSNDYPSDAIVLVGDRGTVDGDNTFATVSADEPVKPVGAPTPINTLWYQWTPSFTGPAFVDTNFSHLANEASIGSIEAPDVHDTVVFVYSGASPSSLTLEAWDADGGWLGRNSRAGFNAAAGTTYYICVATGGLFTRTGAFHLNYYRGDSAGELFIPGPSGQQGSVLEGSRSLPLIVRRRYAGDYPASCLFRTLNTSTATPGVDFTAISQTISFTVGAGTTDWEVDVPLSSIDDNVFEGPESIQYDLSSPSSGASIPPAQSFGQVWLDDDDSAPPPKLYLPATNFRVKENSYMNYLTVRRMGDSAYDEELHQSFMTGTAKPEIDFSLPQGFTIPAYQTSASMFFVVNDDDVFEPDETMLINVSGGLQYTVTIEDDDPYIPVAGRLYAGFNYAADARFAVVFANVTGAGNVTGKVTAVGKTISFAGKLSERGRFSVPVVIEGQSRAMFIFTMAATDTLGTFDVSLLDTRTQLASKTTARIQSYTGTSNPCPWASSCTVAGSGDVDVWMMTAATLKIDAAGVAAMAGKLFDGTAYTAAGSVDGTGTVAAVASLFAGQGCVGIKGNVPTAANQVVIDLLTITRPGVPGNPLKLGSKSAIIGANVCRYTPPAVGQRALDAWQTGTGTATLSNGPLLATQTRAITISPANLIVAPSDTLKLKLTLSPSTGVFTGSFILPGTLKTLSIYGVLTDLPALNGTGTGFFFDGAKGGIISLAK